MLVMSLSKMKISKGKPYRLSFLVFMLVIYTIMMYILMRLTLVQDGNKEIGLMPNMVTTVQPKTQKGSSFRVDIRRCDGCYKWEYPLRIQPKEDFCLNHEGDFDVIDLLILCNSKHSNSVHRQVLRDIYKPATQGKHKVKLVFLFGEDPRANHELEEQLLIESSTHGDILQAAVNGTYNSLTIIGHNGYQWALDNCPKAKFIAKISDDNLMNLPAILDLLDQKGAHELDDVVFGPCAMRREPYRSPSDKWYVSYEQYPFALYPEFCAGSCFIMSMATVKEVMREAANIAFSSNADDVNIGIIIQLTGHRVCHIPNFAVDIGKLIALVTGPNPMKYSNHEVCKALRTEGPAFGVHLHAFHPEFMKFIWMHCGHFRQNLVKDLAITCRRRRIPDPV